ncbi:MAG: hypothetical protein OXG97_02140 [Candidatus Poribacteria bacterium]|nr:hypothetical protein [Candidatus Poribacteria bacterium]
MRYVRMTGWAWHTTPIVALTLCVCIAYAEILFHDDFERLEIDLGKWAPQVSWGIEDNDTRHDVLGRKVLGVWGGGAGLSITDLPEEFDYYADFNAKNGGSLGLVFHARNNKYFYMHEISTAGSKYAPQHIRWHINLENNWSVEITPFADERKRRQNVWYRVKFEVRKNHKFKAYLGKVGAKWNRLVFVGEWSDNEKRYEKGKIGFYTRGGNRGAAAHYAQYDNVFVTTPEFNIFSVEPRGKLAVVWGELKK